MPHILVTDDDATTRQMIRGVLKKHGYTVTTASDGVSALRAMQEKKFDLVLLDIWMPKMTGRPPQPSPRGKTHSQNHRYDF